jgi:excinuclease ABC subunit A
MSRLEDLSAKENIIIKGARMHNLKNVDVAIKRNSFTVVSGLSGSGKSSLAFDTLYAEGQRRYIESLSAYARQFLGKIEKPKVDYIKGISPAIAIEQKVNTRNPRSTVGTSTEIYDYVKLLFARIGKTYSPVSGELVKKHNVDDVIKSVLSWPNEARLLITVKVDFTDTQDLKKRIEILELNGFTRLLANGMVVRIDEFVPNKTKDVFLVIDRIVVNHSDEGFRNRLADSVELAFFDGHGTVQIRPFDKPKSAEEFTNLFELDGIRFEEPDVHFLSFNNPRGACPTCEGFGSVVGIDPDLVIPDQSISVFQDGIVCWKGEKMSEWKDDFITKSSKLDFPIHRSYLELTQKEKDLVWHGKGEIRGLDQFFEFLQEQSYKIQYRVMLSRYRGKTT